MASDDNGIALQTDSKPATKPKSKYSPTNGFDKHPEHINKTGRPKKGLAITDVIAQMLVERPEIKRALAAKLMEMAMGGDLTAINTLMDRLEGRPLQRNDITVEAIPRPILGGENDHEIPSDDSDT